MILAIENQSAFERDVLANFKGKGSRWLLNSLSAGVALFHNVLPDLQHAGVRLRIVASGSKFSDTPGFELREQLLHKKFPLIVLCAALKIFS
jgi:hypothetical protein